MPNTSRYFAIAASRSGTAMPTWSIAVNRPAGSPVPAVVSWVVMPSTLARARLGRMM